MDAFIIEEEEMFSKFFEPSRKFLKFAEHYLSNGKADAAHNNTVSFRNCMIRIPGITQFEMSFSRKRFRG